MCVPNDVCLWWSGSGRCVVHLFIHHFKGYLQISCPGNIYMSLFWVFMSLGVIECTLENKDIRNWVGFETIGAQHSVFSCKVAYCGATFFWSMRPIPLKSTLYGLQGAVAQYAASPNSLWNRPLVFDNYQRSPVSYLPGFVAVAFLIIHFHTCLA